MVHYLPKNKTMSEKFKFLTYLEYVNPNTTKFISAVPLEMDKTNGICHLEI